MLTWDRELTSLSQEIVLNRLAIPRSMVQSVIMKFKKFGMIENLPGRGRKPQLSPRVILKDIAKNLDTLSISVSTHPINRNGCMETNHDKFLFNNHATLLLSLILPKCSWTKKIAFRNMYYDVMKQKVSSLDIMVHRRFGTRKVRLSSQRTHC